MHRILVLCSLIWSVVLLIVPAIGCQQQAILAPTPAPAPFQTPTRAQEPELESTLIPPQETQSEKKNN